ncbi:hypothetical protein DERP_012656 [Dermatophagoides pteronyssinus]|uniref:Uncharacterized protein n=1 Tax=Dermatophagoides pteronyssinus TaxID=6956 RepID=A0ABQ8IYL5_DERPT|nr:hypothetical protein DERP_012656 [Dermatophagoides pteronyssinus]
MISIKFSNQIDHIPTARNKQAPSSDIFLILNPFFRIIRAGRLTSIIWPPTMDDDDCVVVDGGCCNPPPTTTTFDE